MAAHSEDRPPAVRFRFGGLSCWVVSRVEAYRAMAASWPGPEDVVWEIGAATGAATVLAAKRVRAVYAVEKAPEKLAKLRALAAEHPNLHVIESDAVAVPCPPSPLPCSLLFLDLGGDAPPWRTMAVAESWADALHCPRVVVRNTALYEALSSAAPLGTLEPSPPPPDAHQPPVAEAADLVVLTHRLLSATSPTVAARLTESLKHSGYRDRKRLRDALTRLGPAALAPLAALLEDPAAPLTARRSAAGAIRRILREATTTAAELRKSPSVVMKWVLGEEPLAAAALLDLLASDDALLRFIARQQLRKRAKRARKAGGDEPNRPEASPGPVRTT